MIKCRIAIFASGNGTNAYKLINYFHNHPTVEIVMLLCNKSNAPVLSKVKDPIHKIICTNQALIERGYLTSVCSTYAIDMIVLAGFLRKLPEELIQMYTHKIINIHPSLLPKYGGEGMYGLHVHQAVVDGNERETGTSIHYVSEEFDTGKIIAQFYTEVLETDTAELIMQKVLLLEHYYYPLVIENLVYSRNE